ncbi:MAG: hypothetical protein KY397_05295 [Gemmatimonadetes bacterium]|nr:hypothetical protein [Gemmatimonadota bacterium]
MKLVASTFAASVGLFLASVAPAQTLRYAADAGATHRYVRSQEDHVVQTVNGQEQVSDIESYWRFATTVESSEGEDVTISVVHDSISVVSPAAQQPLDFAGLYGVPLRIRMTDRGEVEEVVLPDSLPEGLGRVDLRTAYGSFYPVLPAEEVQPGFTWADSTEVRTTQNGMDVTVMRINTYTVAGSETAEGREAVRVDFEAAFDIAGSGNQQGAEISLSGTGRGSGRFFIAPEPGLYLGGEEDTEMAMDAFVSAGEQNLLIPIAQTRSETVDLVE